MPKSSKINESYLLEACEAAQAQKKPNISKIAREYGVPYATLRDRVKKHVHPRLANKPVNRALKGYQEEALIQWIVCMRDRNMPVTPKLLEEYANQALRRAGESRQVSKMWAYRFEKRLPEHLNLGPAKQKIKESKRIQAEDAGLLTYWYNQLAGVVKKDTPARLVYNFDECGFQPGEGKSRKVISSKGSKVPDLAESERGENITAIECVAADGWQMDPWFIFKGNGIFMEFWFNESEALPPDTTIATSPNGWISDELAVQWLQSFINATNERTKKGEKRILIFDGHGSHLTVEFLQLCEDNGVIPFGFLPHTTHLCQPLDGKPFLSYKQHFRRMNNELSYWAGEPVGKSEFLHMIGPVREKAFNQRIIREAFKDRGIWPVNSKIADDLAILLWEGIPDIYAPDLDKMTPSTPPSQPPSRPPSSSSIDISPPRTIQALKKNQAKLSKHADLLTPKLQRNLERIFEHNRIAAEHLAIANETIGRIRAAQAPLRRQYTKRQVKPLSQSGILTLRDANRSIASRKAKDAAAQERRLQTQWEKVHGKPPPLAST
ncbi:hypothetical protein V6Z77_010319 [Aspergillus fumigatus]